MICVLCMTFLGLTMHHFMTVGHKYTHGHSLTARQTDTANRKYRRGNYGNGALPAKLQAYVSQVRHDDLGCCRRVIPYQDRRNAGSASRHGIGNTVA